MHVYKFWQTLLFVSLATTANCSAFAISPESLKTAAFHARWLRLLQMEKKGNHFQSRADSLDFFIHPNGKTDPYAELEATLQAFAKPQSILEKRKEHPLCLFTARKLFLEQTLNTSFSNVECQDFNEWKEGLNPETISLIFSSTYANNPSSLFGHTYLRADQKKEAQQTNHLTAASYGISFGAEANENDPGIIYGLRGIFGGYEGSYSVAPYYLTVGQYVHQESRDMWEYELNFNKEEMNWLLVTLWEYYRNAKFDYFFFDENCAYQVLALLEVVKLNWNLLEHFPAFVIPSETVFVVTQQPDAIKNIHFRPSARRRLFRKIESLSSSQSNDFYQMLFKHKDISFEPANVDALDTYLEWLRFRQLKEKAPPDSKIVKELQSLLPKRAAIKKPATEINISNDFTSPDEGHAPKKLSAGLTLVEDEVFGIVRYRLGYHGSFDPPQGYDPHLAITWLSLGVSSNFKNRFRIEDYEGVRIESFQPTFAFDPHFSWTVALFGQRNINSSAFCGSCLVHKLEGGGGFTFAPLSYFENFKTVALVKVNTGKTQEDFSLAPSLSFAAQIAGASKKIRVTAEVFRWRNFTNDLAETEIQTKFEASWALSKRYAFSGEASRNHLEISAQYYH